MASKTQHFADGSSGDSVKLWSITKLLLMTLACHLKLRVFLFEKKVNYIPWTLVVHVLWALLLTKKLTCLR